MKSQPFQTAFTSMTLALVIFLSIWLIQATQAELNEKARVPLQVKAGTDGPGHRRTDPRPDPFDSSEVSQADSNVADPQQMAASEDSPSVKINGVRVSEVSGPQISDQTTDANRSSKTLELPQINIYAGGTSPVAGAADEGEIDRMKAALVSESTAREELQSKVDALTREQAALKTALEREQTNLSLTKQQKESLASKLEESKSELDRLNSTTRELRSEAAEMKNSLREVTNEFDSLKQRFENFQKRPRELASLPLQPTQSKPATPPPVPDVTSRRKDEFLPPIEKDAKSGAPLAPPSDDSHVPLIEADPLFRESEAEGNYPAMMCGESCTDTGETPARRGLLPLLCSKLKRSNADCCRTSSAQKSASCTEAGTCEPDNPRCKGLFRKLSELVKSDNGAETYRCSEDCSTACGCGCQHHASRGLIPNITRWIEARRARGCFEECCCDRY